MKFKYKKVPRSADPKAPHLPIPYIPIVISRGADESLPFFALLDSGADKIVMAESYATSVGITDITTGAKETTIGVGSQVIDVYYHDGIDIQIVGDDKKLPSQVGFVPYVPNQKKVPPLLGRSFFKNFKKVTFDENNEDIELK